LFERQPEFQIMNVLGIPVEKRHAMVMSEVNTLIRWGLGIGSLASFVSILPLFRETVSVRNLGMMFGLILIMGGVAFWSATLARKQAVI